MQDEIIWNLLAAPLSLLKKPKPNKPNKWTNKKEVKYDSLGEILNNSASA